MPPAPPSWSGWRGLGVPARPAEAGRASDAEPLDLDRLCDLGTPAPAWDPSTTRLRIGDPGGDELVERWFGPAEHRAEQAGLGPRVIAALLSLERLSKSPTSAEFSLARRHCLLHAAACCLQIWRTNRDRLAPAAAEGEWLVLCFERLAGCSDKRASASARSKWMVQSCAGPGLGQFSAVS